MPKAKWGKLQTLTGLSFKRYDHRSVKTIISKKCTFSGTRANEEHFFRFDWIETYLRTENLIWNIYCVCIRRTNWIRCASSQPNKWVIFFRKKICVMVRWFSVVVMWTSRAVFLGLKSFWSVILNLTGNCTLYKFKTTLTVNS